MSIPVKAIGVEDVIATIPLTRDALIHAVTDHKDKYDLLVRETETAVKEIFNKHEACPGLGLAVAFNFYMNIHSNVENGLRKQEEENKTDGTIN